jgi:FMN-dependent NADH-azoreductase
MSKLLYIKTSPRGERSFSIAVADAFVAAYKEANPEDETVLINLFDKDLPPLDGFALQAKYTILHGMKHSDKEQAAWRKIEDIIEEFKSTDKYVFAVPMWNFSIPYQLKHYIDIVVQPTYTFSFSPEEGYKGLVTGKRVFIAYARGGEYVPGTEAEAFDFQTKYFETILGFMGLTDIEQVVIEPTLMDPDSANEKGKLAIAKAKGIAQSF